MQDTDESVCVCVCMNVGGASIVCQGLKDKMLSVWCCSVCVAQETFSKCPLAVLVFTMSLQLQRPFNLKTSQFESPQTYGQHFSSG